MVRYLIQGRSLQGLRGWYEELARGDRDVFFGSFAEDGPTTIYVPETNIGEGRWKDLEC